MPTNSSEYGDDRELTRYVWHNDARLISLAEKLAAKRLHAETKAAASTSHRIRSMLQRKWGAPENSEVDALLADGPDALRDRVRRRVLSEYSAEIIVNRCPKCSCIVSNSR